MVEADQLRKGIWSILLYTTNDLTVLSFLSVLSRGEENNTTDLSNVI